MPSIRQYASSPDLGSGASNMSLIGSGSIPTPFLTRRLAQSVPSLLILRASLCYKGLSVLRSQVN